MRTYCMLRSVRPRLLFYYNLETLACVKRCSICCMYFMEYVHISKTKELAGNSLGTSKEKVQDEDELCKLKKI